MLKTLFCAALLAAIANPAFAASCKISEYRAVGKDGPGNVIAAPLEPPVTTQTVSYTTATASSAFNSATNFLRVVCDAKAHYRVTTAGTAATATDPFVPANLPEFFAVNPNLSYRISFYDGTS